MPRIRTMADNAPAHGTPAIRRHKPTAMAWMNATPTTPWATTRLVAVDNSASLPPRSGPMTRSKIAPTAPGATFAECHDDAGDDECCHEHQQPAANGGHKTEHPLRQIADLGLHALHQ